MGLSDCANTQIALDMRLHFLHVQISDFLATRLIFSNRPNHVTQVAMQFFLIKFPFKRKACPVWKLNFQHCDCVDTGQKWQYVSFNE